MRIAGNTAQGNFREAMLAQMQVVGIGRMAVQDIEAEIDTLAVLCTR